MNDRNHGPYATYEEFAAARSKESEARTMNRIARLLNRVLWPAGYSLIPRPRCHWPGCARWADIVRTATPTALCASHHDELRSKLGMRQNLVRTEGGEVRVTAGMGTGDVQPNRG